MSPADVCAMDSINQGHTLIAGDLRAVVRADLGGSLAGLWHGQTPVLRSVEAAALQGPRQSACFPLIPYSNRLGWRRFMWQGHEYTTVPNFEGSPHSLHGVGWQRPWQAVVCTNSAMTLRMRHLPDADWPFAFDAEQRLVLTPRSLRMELDMTNTDKVPQPAGLGWHPYFPKRAASCVDIRVNSRWEADATLLPTHAVDQPALRGRVDAMNFDHCFGGWNGTALIEDAELMVRLSASVPWLVVFTPPAQPHFCVEPVSHVNDAIHAPDPAAHGLVTLPPGKTLSAWMTLDIEPQARSAS